MLCVNKGEQVMRIAGTFLAVYVCLQPASGQFGWLNKKDYFVPATTLSGIGLGRADITDAVLEKRTEFMVDSQTFSIMRDPQALAGAQRITSSKLQKVFDDASRRSGLPSS